MPPPKTSTKSFFRIILSSTLQNGKLKIPNKFVKDHKDELRDCLSFSVPSGCSWSVRIQRETDGSIWFHEGLLKFMEDNSIANEFFLIFEYRGGSKFSVIIFDLTATEIEYNCNNSSTTSEVSQIRNSDVREGIGYLQKADSGDDSIEFLGSSAGHLFNQAHNSDIGDIIGDSRKAESGDNSIEYLGSSAGVSCETATITRSKTQILVRGIEVDGVNVQSTLPTFVEPSRPSSRQKRKNKCLLSETDKIRRKKQMLRRDMMVGDVNVCSTPQRRDMGCNKTSHSHKDSKKTYNSSGGQNSAKHINKKERVSSSTSPRECADERTIQDDNRPSPTFKATLKSYNIKKGLLAFPSEFVRVNIPYSTNLITLFDSDDNEWVVHFIRTRNYSSYLSGGWMQFVKDKKLMEGDVCIFERIDGSEVKLKTNIHRSANGMNSKMYRGTTGFDASDGSAGDFGKERNVEAEHKSLHNFFEVTLTPSYINKGYLTVPSNFAKLLVPHYSTMFIKIEDANNNEWAVRFIHKPGNHIFGKGWGHFVREKKLMVGDICRFERVRGDEVKMKVTISRPGNCSSMNMWTLCIN